MTAKPKIAVVAGDLLQPRFLALFEALGDDFDVCVYALHGDDLVNRHGTGLKLRLFDIVDDMPGYMRGLEEELVGVRAIIGLESSRLATFQAVRAARKFSVPLGVVVNEFQPYFYERFANIRAIQFDICNKADRFWATSALAAQSLRLDGVQEDAITEIAPVVLHSRFRRSPAHRLKFRSYIGIGERDFVVLFHGDLETWSGGEELLRALHLLMQRRSVPLGRTLRLVFAGNGQASRDLKYRAHDLGLGRSVMFLHQDPEPFLVDLYAASDVIYAPRMAHPEFHEDLPLHVLEAMACGVVPLVRAGSIAHELAGAPAQTFADDAYVHVAASLQALITDSGKLEREADAGVAKVLRDNAIASVRKQLVRDVHELIRSHAALMGAGASDAAQIVAEIDALLAAGRERDALLRIEEALLANGLAAGDRAQLLCRRGDALYGMGNVEGAAAAFTESVKLNERDPRPLRGLGFIAWQGHANEEALLHFKRAHALKDDDPQTMLGIGLIYRRLGLTEEAVFWLEKCLSHHDYPPSALAALAQTCAQASRPHYGIKVLERALETVGENRMLMMTLGQLYLNEGLTERGQEMLQRAMGASA